MTMQGLFGNKPSSINSSSLKSQYASTHPGSMPPLMWLPLLSQLIYIAGDGFFCSGLLQFGHPDLVEFNKVDMHVQIDLLRASTRASAQCICWEHVLAWMVSDGQVTGVEAKHAVVWEGCSQGSSDVSFPVVCGLTPLWIVSQGHSY